MTDDVFFETVPGDEEFREVYYTGLPITEGIMVAIAWFLIAWPRRKRR